MRKISCFIIMILSFIVNSKTFSQNFDNIERIDLGKIENDLINEASGLAASWRNKDVLWTHNDSGGKNCLYALTINGKHLGSYYIKGAKAKDWEDLAIGTGPIDSEDYIYIGDVGDNKGNRKTKYIYRVIEPEIPFDKVPKDSVLSDVDKIAFTYPDGNRDSEAIMVDPFSKDIYVISKREEKVRVYVANYPQKLKKRNVLKFVCELNMNNVTAADISSTGCEIIIKTYDEIFYWNRLPGQKLVDTWKKEPKKLLYIMEPQGEALTWHPNSLGYYTTTEEKDSVDAHIYFYKF